MRTREIKRKPRTGNHGSLVRMSALITGSIDAANDITQKAFTRLLHDRNEYLKGSFQAYGTTIAFRLALKEKARVRRTKQVGSPDWVDDSRSPIHSVVESEEQRNLVQ